jgi:Zn-finger nucleic acid-binding protein
MWEPVAMKCPTCADTVLVMTERQGVEIDYCPSCRGVWLDRGELDKLLERAVQQPAPAATPQGATATPVRSAYPSDYRGEHRGGYRHDDEHRERGYKDYRRKSWLSDIFD